MATATAVQWSPECGERPSAGAWGSSAVNSSPQLSTSSCENGTPEPSASPSSSATYCGSRRRACSANAGARRSASANVSRPPVSAGKLSRKKATDASTWSRADSPTARPSSR